MALHVWSTISDRTLVGYVALSLGKERDPLRHLLDGKAPDLCLDSLAIVLKHLIKPQLASPFSKCQRYEESYWISPSMVHLVQHPGSHCSYPCSLGSHTSRAQTAMTHRPCCLPSNWHAETYHPWARRFHPTSMVANPLVDLLAMTFLNLPDPQHIW